MKEAGFCSLRQGCHEFKASLGKQGAIKWESKAVAGLVSSLGLPMVTSSRYPVSSDDG